MDFDLGTIRFRAAMKEGEDINNLGTFDLSEIFDEDSRRVQDFYFQPVEFADSRALWADRDSAKRGLLCESDDGVTGDGEPGGSCAACPMSRRGCRVQRFVEGWASLVDPASDEYMIENTDRAILVLSFAPSRPGGKPNTTETTARVLKKGVEKGSDQWLHLTGVRHSSGGFTYARVDFV